MAKELKTNAMRILDRERVSYEILTYDCPEFRDGTQMADKLGLPYETVFKTLVAVGKSGGYFVYVIPVAQELDCKAAARAVAEKAIELVAVKNLLALTGYVRGGCTAVGMKKVFPTVLDESAMRFDRIAVSGGRIGTTLLVAPADFVRVTRATVAPITMNPDGSR